MFTVNKDFFSWCLSAWAGHPGRSRRPWAAAPHCPPQRRDFSLYLGDIKLPPPPLKAAEAHWKKRQKKEEYLGAGCADLSAQTEPACAVSSKIKLFPDWDIHPHEFRPYFTVNFMTYVENLPSRPGAAAAGAEESVPSSRDLFTMRPLSVVPLRERRIKVQSAPHSLT